MGIGRALIWKEWLGLRWKVTALNAIAAGMFLFWVVYDFRLDRELRHVASGYFLALYSYLAIAPLFLGMHAAAAESADKTLPFVRSLPCSRQYAGLIRVLSTFAALILPLIGMGVVAMCAASASNGWNISRFALRDTDEHDLLVQTAICASLAGSIFCWTVALAMNQPTETRAGAIGIAALIGWVAVIMAAFAVVRPIRVFESWLLWSIIGVSPLGIPFLVGDNLPLAPRQINFALAEQFVVWILLASIAVRRYARLEAAPWKSYARPRGTTAALLWSQSRQAVPIVAFPLLAIILFLFSWTQTNRSPAGLVLVLIPYLGSIWAIITGASLFTSELEPRLHSFWRSRPIDPGQWFRVKYAVGAAIILLCFDLPAIGVSQLATIRSLMPNGQSLAYLACWPLLHLAVYSIAVLISCLVRHTIYAGILSTSAMAMLVFVPGIHAPSDGPHPFDVNWVLSQFAIAMSQEQPMLGIRQLLAFLALNVTVVAAATIAACQFVRIDYSFRR